MNHFFQSFVNGRSIVIVAILFVVALFLVEVGPCGSRKVAEYNEGYGTFDMKRYDTATVTEVLGKTTKKGFQTYRGYFACDTLFLLVFGCLQLMITHCLYSKVSNQIVYTVVMLVPILRGIFDLMENTLLLIILQIYPKVNSHLVGISSMATQVKLLMIKVWMVSVACGIVVKVVTCLQKR